MLHPFTRRTALGLCAIALLAVPTWAQQQPRLPISRYSNATVKPDRVGDYEAAVKQYNEVLAKVPGTRARLIYQSLTGPTEFRLARSYKD